MKFQIVFDSTASVADWWFGYSPVFLAFAIMAAYIFYLLWRSRSQRLAYKSALVLVLVLSGVRVASRTEVDWLRYRGLYHYIGLYQTVEGPVQNCQFISKSKSSVERFRVEGVDFSYANGGVPQCFHKTAKDGGPIRDGLVVRISYAKIDRDYDPACIVKLEIPSSPSKKP
jgi:hypothetical protein